MSKPDVTLSSDLINQCKHAAVEDSCLNCRAIQEIDRLKSLNARRLEDLQKAWGFVQELRDDATIAEIRIRQAIERESE